MTTVEQLRVLEGMGTCHVIRPTGGGFSIVFQQHGSFAGLPNHTTVANDSMAKAVDDLYNYINCRVWIQLEIMDTEYALKSSKPTLIIP